MALPTLVIFPRSSSHRARRSLLESARRDPEGREEGDGIRMSKGTAALLVALERVATSTREERNRVMQNASHSAAVYEASMRQPNGVVARVALGQRLPAGSNVLSACPEAVDHLLHTYGKNTEGRHDSTREIRSNNKKSNTSEKMKVRAQWCLAKETDDLKQWIQLLHGPCVKNTKRNQPLTTSASTQQPRTPYLRPVSQGPPTLITDIINHELQSTGIPIASYIGDGELTVRSNQTQSSNKRPIQRNNENLGFYCLCAVIGGGDSILPHVVRQLNYKLQKRIRNDILHRLGLLTAALLMRYLSNEQNPKLFGAFFNLILLMLDGEHTNRATLLQAGQASSVPREYQQVGETTSYLGSPLPQPPPTQQSVSIEQSKRY